MTDHELLLAIYNDVQSMKDDLETVKRDVKHLKKEAIKCRLWMKQYLMKSKEYMVS